MHISLHLCLYMLMSVCYIYLRMNVYRSAVVSMTTITVTLVIIATTALFMLDYYHRNAP
jgi:hypothetical protein